jgi:hydroxymethylpyrimidine/phosphomethylpyrimidine kinase
MPEHSKYILTIGGFDPCNGAGISQDVKTLESLGCQALSVITCMTIQNDREIREVRWLEIGEVFAQIDVLLDRYPVGWAKISLTKNMDDLVQILEKLKTRLPGVRIIWDPIRAASSGFVFNRQDTDLLHEVLRKIYLATPNWKEIAHWGTGRPEEIAERLASLVNICLKGGHRPEKIGSDMLFLKDGAVKELHADRIADGGKHGSGCVFSSAVLASLADGEDLENSVVRAKQYVTAFIESSSGNLGSHFKTNSIKSAGIEY